MKLVQRRCDEWVCDFRLPYRCGGEPLVRARGARVSYLERARPPQPGARAADFRRITSYNVCYTKLLRVLTAGVFPLLHTGRPWFGYWLVAYPNQRNLAVAIGNGPPSDAALSALEARRQSASPLVGEHT